MIYLDAAAVVKLIRREEHSDDLRTWVSARSSRFVSSVLLEVEVPRALRREAPGSLVTVPEVLVRIFRYEVNAIIRSIAASFTEPSLRSLDAVHLATAQLVRADLEAFVTYDKRLLAAAAGVGLPIASPGT